MQPWCTPFPIWNQSIVPCPVLTVASWPIYRFRRRQIRWSGTPTLQEFSTLLWSTQSKVLVQSVKQENFFLKFSSFRYDPTDVGNLIFGSSAFSKFNLYVWKFLVHILLKPRLKDFEHYLTSIWNEFNCAVVWTFFGIALLWDWNENWPFPFLWPLLSFPNLLAYWVQYFNNIIF